MLGEEIILLVDREQEAGFYEVEFDGTNFESGIYFYKLSSGDFADMKKLILLK